MKSEVTYNQETDSHVKVIWHLCPWCEGQDTGRTETQVLEASFKKVMERKSVRAKRQSKALPGSEEQTLTGVGCPDPKREKEAALL